MKKRHMKMLALFLSATMVFSSNLATFAANPADGNGDLVQAEVAEGEDPEIVGIPEEPNAVYQAAFAVGWNDALADDGTGKTDNYWPGHTDEVRDGKKFSEKTEDYQAAYRDGYEAYNHEGYFNSYDDGFEAGVNDSAIGVDNFKDINRYDSTDPAYDATYKAGYDAGFKAGEANRNQVAYKRGYNRMANNDLHYAYKDSNPWADDIKTVYESVTKAKREELGFDPYNETYVTEWQKGFKDAYDARESLGKKQGIDDAKWDARTAKAGKLPSEIAEADADDLDAVHPGYKNHWSIYNSKYTAEGTGVAVNETYIKGFKAGYDSVFAKAAEATKKDDEDDAARTAYNDGYNLGYQNAGTDIDNNNTEADKAAKAENGGYWRYNNDKNPATGVDEKHTDAEKKQFNQGYEDGYNYRTKDLQNDTGYNLGYTSGYGDGTHDRYGDTQAYAWMPVVDTDGDGIPDTPAEVEGGFYQPDYPNSTYSMLKTSESDFAKGFIKGYDEGYKAGLNSDAVGDHFGKPYDYTSAELDAWRVSTDPAKWDTAQVFIEENAPRRNNGIYSNLFFDSHNFYKNARPANGHGWTANAIQFRDGDGNNVGTTGRIIATSPFQYYFDLYEHDHLVDKTTLDPTSIKLTNGVYVNDLGINNGSTGEYLYKALPASSNKAKKPKKNAPSDNGITYVIVRYRLADAENGDNYKVKRYSYDASGAESVQIDHITDYYQGTDKDGQAILEPVVEYDSRKVVGIKGRNPKEKYNQNADASIYNDKNQRYAIDAEALVISWDPTSGAPAKLLGALDTGVAAKDNVNATVPNTFLTYQGDTEMEDIGMISEYTGGTRINNAHNFIQGDKGINDYDPLAGVDLIFSKYYKVTKDKESLKNGHKVGSGVAQETTSVAFAGTQSAAKLTAEQNAYMNKKGTTPTFTLKAKIKDPLLKAYAKDIKLALKNGTFNFEISRMKIASDYDTHLGDTAPNDIAGQDHYDKEFKYEDTAVFKALLEKFVAAPKRSDYNSLDAYKKAVEDYKTAKEKFGAFGGDGGYINSDEFKKLALDEFKKAVAAYKAEYNALLASYGSNLEYMQKWIEEEWALLNANNDITFGNGTPANNQTFPYTVTKDNRTNAGQVIPVGNTPKYKTAVPEDANCDGTITAIEHYEYTELVPSWTKGVNDPRFDGKLEAGDNITGFDEGLIKGEIDYDWTLENGITVQPGDEEILEVRFDYRYDLDNNTFWHNLYIVPTLDGKYYYGGHNDIDVDGIVDPGEINFLTFHVYIDFLEDAPTDKDLINENDALEDTVLYPGGHTVDILDVATNGFAGTDRITIDFVDPKLTVKKKKGVSANMTLAVKPVLITRVVDANGDRTPSQKKLKVYSPKLNKDGTSANSVKKLPKADIQLESKMAETEPFIVATGMNNFEGQIAMRQRKNGGIGYGYFKNDDYYYIYSDED